MEEYILEEPIWNNLMSFSKEPNTTSHELFKSKEEKIEDHEKKPESSPNNFEILESSGDLLELKLKNSKPVKTKRKTRKKSDRISCQNCDLIFSDQAQLEKHEDTHKVFHCDICDKDYQPRENYNRHMKNVHNEGGNLPRVTCNICHRTLKNKYFLKTHLKIHAPDTDYKCPHCDYKNNNLFYMKIHINRHTKQPSYQCEICGEKFYEKPILQTHIQVKHGRGFECKICFRSYGTKQRLREHEKTHDPNYIHVNKHQCEECGQTYKYRAQLKKHLLKHKGLDVKYDCNVCGKVVTTKKSFTNHMKIHTGEKSSVCDICGKAFTVEKYLIVHRRTHTGEKPYSCDVCGKTFTQRVSLVVHNRYHTGERPYRCHVCNKGFVTNTLLSAHLKTHVLQNYAS